MTHNGLVEVYLLGSSRKSMIVTLVRLEIRLATKNHISCLSCTDTIHFPTDLMD